MASDGLGKIKNKKSKDAGKPYDRQKSLLRTVGSKLKDFLTPSWLRESSWQSTANHDDEVEAQDVAMEATEDQTDVTMTQRSSVELAESSVKNTTEGLVVEFDGYQATFDHSIIDADRNFDSSSISRPPLSSLAYGDFSSAAPRSVMQPSTSCGSGRPFSANYSSAKRSATQHSGDDSFSDAREFVQSEAVGAPCKKLCIERNNTRTAFVDQPGEEQVKETSRRQTSGVERSYLWHTSAQQSSASRSGSVSRPAPTATATSANAKKPGFDLVAFCNTPNHSEQSQWNSSLLDASYRQSPFYRGKTTYGGASARSKHVNVDQDYQILPSVRRQVKKIEPALNASGQSTMSTTAKRILDGMNKNEQQQLHEDTTISSIKSSQLDSPLSFTPNTYKRNSLQASGPKTQLALKTGPPVNERSTPTHAIIKQSMQAYQGHQPGEMAVSRTENTDRNVARSSTFAPLTYDLPSGAPSAHAPGKMRREQPRKHYSNRTTEKEYETPMNVNLPLIPLPVKNLQPFTSNAVSSAGFFHSAGSKAEAEKAMTFTFSAPTFMETDSEPTKEVQPKSFHFCSPINKDGRQSNGISTSSSFLQPPAPASVAAAATKEPASKSSLAFDFNVKAAVKKAQPSSEMTSSLGFSPAAELKQGSVMDLLGQLPKSSESKMSVSASSSATSTAAKPVSPATGVVSDKKSLSELFKAPSNKWSCPGCFVLNSDDATTCVCCSERKPATKSTTPSSAVFSAPTQVSSSVSGASAAGPLSKLFKPTSNTWNCPTCMVNNANSQNECPCCGTKQPGGSKMDKQPSANSVSMRADASSKPKEGSAEKNEVPKSSGLPGLSTLFKKPAGQWVCPTCSVPNQEDQMKCCACEEPKPGAKMAPSNGTVSTTAPSAGQVEAQGFKFNPAAFGSGSVGQSVFKAPSSADGSGIAPGGGFKMTLPSGGFSGFGSGGFSTTQSSSGKQDSVPVSGGVKPTGFVSFGQVPNSDANGSLTKPEVMSFLPPGSNAAAKSETSSVTPSFSGVQFGSTESKPGGFSFKPTTGTETGLKAAPVSFAFGSSGIAPIGGSRSNEPGIRFGEKVTSDKNVDSTSVALLRPPLRDSEDKSKENIKPSAETTTGSSSQNNCMDPHISSQSTVSIFGSTSSAFDSTKFAPPVSSAPFSFGVPASTSVGSTPATLFGLTKPSTDASAPKFNFTATPGSTAVAALSGFGAPSTSLSIAVTQPVFTAPSSITSASIAPPASAPRGLFAAPAMAVGKPPAQDPAKSSLFNFGQNPSDAVPALFKFGTQPAKEEAKPASTNIFQFGQQSQITAPSSLFQFGASSGTVSGAGMFNSTISQSSAASVFGQPSKASGTFSFGVGTGGAQASSAGVFTFGAKPSDAASKPDVMPSFSLIGSKRSMQDEVVMSKRIRSSSEDMPMQDVEPMQSPKQPSVGFSVNPQPSGFAFNASQASASVNNPGFFGAKPANPVPAFGNPSTLTTPMGTSPFTFTGQQQTAPAAFTGQQPSAPASAFGNQNMSNGGTKTGFTFGAGATAPSVPNAFNFSSTPSFNFATTPSNPSGNITFNAQPSAAPPVGRIIKKGVRRTIPRR